VRGFAHRRGDVAVLLRGDLRCVRAAELAMHRHRMHAVGGISDAPAWHVLERGNVAMRRATLCAVLLAACGGSPAAIDAPGGDIDSATVDSSVDAPACAQLPSGALMRLAGPMLRNGPQTYDNAKTGPRVVIKFGPSDYRMWYEAVADNLYTTVGYATSTDGITWTKVAW